jgi:hypothetical protein
MVRHFNPHQIVRSRQLSILKIEMDKDFKESPSWGFRQIDNRLSGGMPAAIRNLPAQAGE